MIKVLFICHGNICRSPMAQYVLQNLVNKRGLEQEFYIDSAATSTEEIGNGIHHGTRKKLEEMGIPYGDHRAVQLRKSDYETYDYLLGMDSWNIRNMYNIIGRKTAGKIYKLLDFGQTSRDIADPWYTGNFDETYEDILEGCEGFLKYLEEQGKI